MKVLITGGYGFIGSHLAERFYKEGHKITVLDNLSTGREGRLKIKHKSILANCEDEKNETYFRSYGFDLVIHCAAQTSVSLSVAHPTQDAEANIVGLVNMLNLAAKYNVKKFVFFHPQLSMEMVMLCLLKKMLLLNRPHPMALAKWWERLTVQNGRAYMGLRRLFLDSRMYTDRDKIRRMRVVLLQSLLQPVLKINPLQCMGMVSRQEITFTLVMLWKRYTVL